MTTFVLVHGAWGGSWGWKDFANLLRKDGHEVYTPSLTGLGERIHLGGPQVNLTTHIKDVENCVCYEDLSDIVLVGASYGGMVVTGVTNRIADRVSNLVYSDAFLPRDGQSCFDLGGAGGRDRAVIEDGWKVMPMRAQGPADEARRAKMGPQPLGTLEEKVRLTIPLEERAFSLTYVKAGQPPRTQGPDFSHFWQASDSAAKDSRWRHYELPCGHGIHREMPQEFNAILYEVAGL
jgi:pimeloyl-ACP methyl ester carboxylesterase